MRDQLISPTPAARELVTDYAETGPTNRRALAAATRLSGQLRQAEKAAMTRRWPTCATRSICSKLDVRLWKSENKKRLHAIRKLLFRPRRGGRKDQPAKLYQADKVPDGVDTDGRNGISKRSKRAKFSSSAVAMSSARSPPACPRFACPRSASMPCCNC